MPASPTVKIWFKLLTPCFFLINSCGMTSDKVVVNTDYRYKSNVTELSKGFITPSLFDPDYKMIGDFATMSTYVYEGKIDPKYHVPIYDRSYEKTYDLTGFFSRWERMNNYPAFPKKSTRWNIRGLMYDVWISKANPSLAVIPFKGTSFSKLSDWHSNLNWVTRYIPFQFDQYEQAAEVTPLIVKKIDSLYGNATRIFTTGHSLGGGLAQQAAYTTPRIKKVFTFNTTPVDGYHYIKCIDTLQHNKGKRIYKVYEKGEVLSGIRNNFDMQNTRHYKDPEVIKVKYNFIRGNLITEHLLDIFADSLRQHKERAIAEKQL